MEPSEEQETSAQISHASNPSASSSLEQVLRFENAVVRIERDLRGSQDQGQLLASVLHKRLSTRLSKAGLTPEQIPERVSVITRTPPPSPRTSTPSSSPPPPLPPRHCQSLGQFTLPAPCSHSCSESELSSISGEVFFDPQEPADTYVTPVVPPTLEDTLLQSVSRPVPEILIMETIEAKERAVSIKSYNLNAIFRNFRDRAFTNE